MPTISGGSSGGIPGVTVSGTPAASQALIATSSSAAGWAYPPGFVFGYDQRTTNVAVASTTEASGTTIIACAAHTFDGGLVRVTFYAPVVQLPSAAIGNKVAVSLFEGATQISRVAAVFAQEITTNDDLALFGVYEFTPTAASHTYTMTAFADSTTGSPTIICGAGGTAAYPPCFVEFTKV